VSLDHTTYPLPRPFMVLATQNPREHAGTFPLPESQLDRFLLRIRIGYPSEADERTILRGAGTPVVDTLETVLDAGDVVELQAAAEQVRADDSVVDYVLSIVTATRRSRLLTLGVSPRGSLALLRAARAHALADGRDYLVPDDVKRLAVPALAHRVLLIGPAADGAGQGAEAVIRTIVQDIPVPR
jgi:MoxR-like ATPase